MLKTHHEGKEQFGEYTIGGKKFFQYPCTAGQKLEVLKVIKSLLKSQLDPKTGAPAPDTVAMMDTLTGDFLPHFLGTILLSENEKVVDLASVRSFVDRGNRLLFEMSIETQREAMDDFFSLNPGVVEELLSLLGIRADNLPPEMLSELRKMSGGSSKPSATDGDSTPKQSSGSTP
jgi:hypothetical protein